MKLLNFQSQNVVVDWISFNIQGLPDPIMIACRLSKHFTSHVLMDDVPSIGFHGFKKKYKVSIRQYTRSKGYWVGTKVIFSGKMRLIYISLLKNKKIDWNIFQLAKLNISRFDLYYFQ